MTNAVSLAQQASTGVSQGFKNRIINGAMVIDQRNAGASVTIGATGSQYTLDRFFAQSINASKYSIQQNAGAVTPPAGFTNYLGVTSLAATSSAAGDYYALMQAIEGYNMADLGFGTANAKTVTVSFQVYSSLTGTFGGSLKNSANNRSYPFTYTVSSANTWTSVSVTIPGDTTGTWLTTNGVGAYLVFNLGVGSTYLASSGGSWQAANYYGVTGSTSVVGTNGATFYITGVQLEVGSSATSFEYRPYGTELQLCQRYYYRISNTGDATSVPFGLGYTRASNAMRPFINFPVQMRVRPTGVETSGTASHYSVYYAGDAIAVCNAVPDFDISSRETALLGAVVGGSPFPSGGVTYLRSNSTSAFLGFSAEL